MGEFPINTYFTTVYVVDVDCNRFIDIPGDSL